MDASEVAVSLVILRLHDFLSKSEEIVIYQKVRDQISDSISNLLRILNARKHAKLDDDHDQETLERKEWLMLLAHRTDNTAEELFVKLLRDQMLVPPKGRLAKVFAQVGFFSEMNPVRAGRKMAKDFMMMVALLSSGFQSSRPSAEGSLPESERASSSSSSNRNQERTTERFESDIVGRDKYVKALLAWLINDDSNLRVISVVGEEGCGKTALVRSVFGRLEVKRQFDCRAWVRVTGLGADSDWMKYVLVDILKQIPLRNQPKDLEHKKEEELFEMLHISLMKLKYLIVLDNFCEASVINELLLPFVDSMRGSRVIVTTPAEMQKFADPWTPDLRLHPDMTHEECKKLLRVSIMRDDDSELEMTILEQRILSKCNGSPTAISLLGGLLSSVKKSNRVALIDRLGDRPTLDAIMSLSFDELPCMMKSCVLYMALFPEEFEVLTRRLFRQWAAEGLLAEAADGSVRMLSAEDCFRELESRNLIHVVRRKLDGSAQSCRMPAFLHKFFCRKAEEFRLLKMYHSDSVPEKGARVMGPNAEQNAQDQQRQEESAPTGHHGYKVQLLRSFASFSTRKLGTKEREINVLKSLSEHSKLVTKARESTFVLKFLFKSPSLHAQFNPREIGTQAREKEVLSPLLDGRPDLLRVLDLEGVYKPVLPKEFGNKLLNLRYLGLRRTALDSIPESVGNLLLLETLDLKHTNITKVTSAIWNAKNLQHLYLSEASFDKPIPCHVLSGKSPNTKLKTLWGLLVETHDSPMIRVLEKLQSLKKLGVTCRPGAVKAVTICISKLARLESLRLRSRDLFGQSASLDLSIMTKPNFLWPKSLSRLYLLGSLRSVEDLSVLPANLKVLTLSMSGLKDFRMSDLGRLNDLIVLRLLARSCANKSLCCEAGFSKLRVLKLWMLEGLRELIVHTGTMPNLEELDIRKCEGLWKVEGLNHIDSLRSVFLTGVQRSLAYGVEVPLRTLVKAKELVPEEE